MKRNSFICTCALLLAALLISLTGCFSNSGVAGQTPSSNNSDSVKPEPIVEKVIATTSGTDKAYYVTLDIKVKNEGAEGVILVQATVTQNSKSTQNEMQVYLSQGESHRLKLTFPLVWEGGKFESNVQALLP